MATENSRWSSPPVIARTLGRWALGAVAALLVLIGVTLALLQVGPLRKSITEFALDQINQGDTHVTIGETGGAWPYHLHIANLSIADGQGVWLKLDEADMRWSPFALLAGRLHITDLTARGLTISRAPASSAPADNTATSFALPSSPVAIMLDAAHINGVTLGRALVSSGDKGVLAQLDLETRIQIERNATDLSLQIRRTDNVPGDVDLKALVDAATKHIALTLNMRDGDASHPGLVSELAGLDAAPLLVTAKVDGVNGAIDGQVNVDGGRSFILETTAKGEWARDLDIAFDANASGRLIRAALASIGGADKLALRTHFRWDHNDNVSLTGIDAEAGPVALTGDAQLSSVSSIGRHALKGSGEIKGIDAFLKENGSAALAALQWQTEVMVDLGKGMAEVSTLKLASPAGEIAYKGDLALDGSTMKGGLTASFADLSPLGAMMGQTLSGSADMALSPFVRQADGDIAGDFVIHTKDLKAADATLTQFANAVTADGSLLLPGDGGFALPAFSIRSMKGTYAVRGNVAGSASGILSGEVHFKADDIGALLTGSGVSGTAALDTTLSGTLDAPEAEVTAMLANGMIGQTKTDLLKLSANAVTGGTGPVELTFKGAPGNARLAALLTLPREGGAELNAIDGDIFGSRFTGDANLDAVSLITATIKGEPVAFAPLASLAGVSLDGSGALSIKAQPVDGRQALDLTLEAPNLETAGIELKRVTMTAKLTDLFGKAMLDASLAAQSGQVRLVHLDKVEAQAKGPLDRFALHFKATGKNETTSPRDVSFEAQAELQENALALADLDLALGDARMTLAHPVTLDLSHGVAAKGLQFDMTGASGPGRMTADFNIASAASLDLQMTHAPLDLMALAMPVDAVHGSADGEASLDAARGKGKLALTFDQVRIAQDMAHENPAFEATLLGDWSGKRLDLTATAQGVSSEPFVFKASLPFMRNQGAAFPALARRGAMSASLDWDGPLASLTAMADLSGQRFSGDASVALKASGDISAPVVSGEATLADGSYENFASGTLLQKLDVRLEGHRSQSLAFTLDGTDGGDGRISAKGEITLDKKVAQAIEISAQISNARLLRRSDIDATLDGTLELTGPLFPPTLEKPALLTGMIASKAMHIQIPESLPVDVPLVDVTEINGVSDQPVSQVATTTPVPLMLDIDFSTDTPARISGRGLDSLWTGKLAVTGRADQPLIKGKMTSERGTLDFIGKTFTLDSGSVNFPGTYPTEPEFNVVLSFTRDDFKAKIAVSGNPAKPMVKFSSTPSLPQDEILSRILFDKKVGELSPMEAVQLARALAEMSGVNVGGSGDGILNRLQESLSLDVLRIDSSPSGATTLSAGKYVQKGVYVGVEQGALASDSSVKVEIEVTPQISVDTRIGQNASGDVGVNWKWDY